MAPAILPFAGSLVISRINITGILCASIIILRLVWWEVPVQSYPKAGVRQYPKQTEFAEVTYVASITILHGKSSSYSV